MPYIPKWERDVLNIDIAGVMTVPGHLNYVITETVKEYIRGHGLSYQTINDVVGALEGAKLEFYRRVAAPYEDGKIEQNGDVF